MLKAYHRQIVRQALQDLFGLPALQVVLAANLGQDTLRGQIGHSEYHFDNNNFAGSYAYIARQRQLVMENLAQNQAPAAWQAFGRLTHALQDFYAHTNYIRLWVAEHPQATPEQIDPQDDTILNSPALISGRLYYPLEALVFIPGLEPLIKPLLPRDSHTWMNLDSSRQGSLFEYAFTAALKRTRSEFFAIQDSILSASGADSLLVFTDTLDNHA